MVARTMALSVKPFTMIGATTRSGLLSSPLRDRFGQHYHLDFYAHADLAQIITRSAHLLGVGIDDQGMARLIRSAGFKVSAFEAGRNDGASSTKSTVGRMSISVDLAMPFRAADFSLDDAFLRGELIGPLLANILFDCCPQNYLSGRQ